MSPNFWFLAQHDPAVLQAAVSAERYVFSDPNTALFKLRQLAEFFARGVAARLGLTATELDSFADVERQLRDAGQLDEQLHQVMRTVRRLGNDAAHSLNGERRDALHSLKLVRQLAIWFHKTTRRDRNFRAGPFVPPATPSDADAPLQDELQTLRDRLAEREDELRQIADIQLPELKQRLNEAFSSATAAQLNEQAAIELAVETEEAAQARIVALETQLRELATEATQSAPPEKKEVAEAAQRAAQQIELDESDTRKLIDEQLVEAGWEADTELLRYSKGARPIKGRNRAIAEWPTANGPADYCLFVGLTPIALVEAKKSRKDVAGSIEQAKRYSRGFAVSSDHISPGGPWDDFGVPFLFATNGRPYLRQIAERSGIWLLDARRSINHPRPLEAWYTPAGLSELLAQDIAAADERLNSEPTDYLPLRDYQANAVREIERQIAAGRREMLVAMATGTGKTITCIGLVYRLIKTGRFRRVLFLVDRAALGEQAGNAFKDVYLENHQTFTDIYDVKELGDLRPDSDTKLHIATIQGMVKRLLYSDDSTDTIPVDAYDCIVVDECHRGYNLDQEMSDAELKFRSEADYFSKYRRVIDHFDAVRIGLTATPALHTTEIFGRPVFQYTYRQAVIDGYLVDHEPPYRLVTALSEDGMRWQQGEAMKVLDSRTNDLQLFNTPDEVEIEIDGFNRKVLTENFNRTICGALAEHIDPTLPGKALIFCVNDLHADMVVRLLKEALDENYGGVHDDTVLKITGAADKPMQLIRRFKNEQLPKIAVTVDLLTTGIDVPAITDLVFLRRIRSRILFEQMLGRATRLCPDLFGPGEEKQRFHVFDAVNLYDALQDVSEMKPVVTRPNISIEQLIEELCTVDDEAFRSQVKDQLLAKLQRKKLSSDQLERLEAATGLDRRGLIDRVRSTEPTELAEWFRENTAATSILAQVQEHPTHYIVSDHPDELRRIERGYGTGVRPSDYLDAFRAYVHEHLNDLPALLVVTQRPRDLTRAQLKELRLALDLAGFTEANLQTAWRETTNQDIAASIVGYIRHVACDQPLVAHSERVQSAMQQILASRPWTDPQRRWLERIGKQLEQEFVVDREALDSGQFRQMGGFTRLNKIFKGELESILHQIAEAMWQAA